MKLLNKANQIVKKFIELDKVISEHYASLADQERNVKQFSVSAVSPTDIEQLHSSI